MKLTFYSNYFNHHQEALCNAFYAILKEGFTFVETEPMEEFRSEMGWGREAPSYVLKSYLSDENYEKAFSLGETSDVVIMGTAPESMIEKRLSLNKLTFRYSERPLKEGRWKVLVPRLLKKFYHNHYRNRAKELYLLSAGAYVSSDYRFLKSYRGKCFRFGYFPEAESRSYEELLKLKNENHPLRILWAGRFLKLKRADLFLRAAKRCMDAGLQFEIVFVGDGREEGRIKKLVKKLKLDKRTVFKGFLSPEETRLEMGKANIFVMTSNFLEGWGSVIYEALSEGSAVIASHAAGAAPFLIEEGETGYLFKSGSVKSLTGRLKKLLENPELASTLGKNAYYNMQKLWNPSIAAKRLIKVSESLLEGKKRFYREGPLSKCPYIYNNWYSSRVKKV